MSALFLGQSLPIVQLYTYIALMDCCVLISFTFYTFMPLWGCTLPSVSRLLYHQSPWLIGLKVVKANWPSVWSWCRRITEMILDNIQFDVLPQRWLEGFCFLCFFSRPGLKIHGCTWRFVSILCFSNILAQPKPSSARAEIGKGLYSELRRKSVQFSGKSPKCRYHELRRWGVFQVKISKS